MRYAFIVAVAAIAASCTTTTPDADVVVTANATLRDGSRVTGEFRTKRISGSTAFAEDLDLNPVIVRSLAFTGTNGESKVVLANGDKFAMKVANKDFKITSMLGELSIPRTNFRSLAFSARKTSAVDTEDGLVFYCTFDDEESVTSPVVGPKGVFQGGDFVPGKNGSALCLPAYTSCAKFEIPKGLLGPAGTIEFWARVERPSMRLTDCGSPRFFNLFAESRHGEISHDWSSNNGGGGCGLTFRVEGLPWMASSNFRFSGVERSDIRPAPMMPEPGWHHYALVWDVNGVDLPEKASAAVFLDGKLVLQTPFVPDWKGPANVIAGATLFFPNREDEMPGYSRRDYAIDDFKIWNSAKTAFSWEL